MIGSVSGTSGRIDINPTDAADLPVAGVQARLAVAALKAEQDIMRLQGQELARLIEPQKGVHLDARA